MTIGHVYKWSHNTTGKWYIGSRIGPSLNSKYTGSGILWSKVKNKIGIENFTKEILYEGENYRQKETEILTLCDAANNESSYNLVNSGEGWPIGEGNPSKNMSDEWKYRCGNAFRGRIRPDHSKNMSGENNPMHGKRHQTDGLKKHSAFSKNKTLEEIYDLEKSIEIKSKISNKLKGVPKSDDFVEKFLKGENNPFYGKHHSEEAKAKMRLASNIRNSDPDYIKKMSDSQKKVKRGKLSDTAYAKEKCMYCGKEAMKTNIRRFHNDNCKTRLGLGGPK